MRRSTSSARIQPETGFYHPDLREFLLPYDAVRTAPEVTAEVEALFDREGRNWPRFYKEVRRIAALPVVLPIASGLSPEVLASLPPTTAPAAALTIVDQS